MEKLRTFIDQQTGLTEADREKIFSCFRHESLRKNEHLSRAGERCMQNTYVLEGCLRVYTQNAEKKESILYFAFEDFWIGDLESFFTGKASLENIQALEDCSLAVIDRDDFLYLLETYPVVKDIQLRKITRSFISMSEQLSAERLVSAEQRYLDLVKQRPDILRRVPQQYIAQYLGIEAPSLSRIRRRLAKK